MINKKGLWFLTLFSLILVLSIYYIAMPNDSLKTTGSLKTKEVSKTDDTVVVELSSIEVLKEEYEDFILKKKKECEEKMSSGEGTTEKNEAYEMLKELNNDKTIMDKLEDKIKNKLELSSFVKKEGNNIVVTVEKKNHNKELALQIMKLVQEEFDDEVIVSVKFIS